MRALEELYEQGRHRVMTLVRQADEPAVAAPVPACPEWSAHDVVAHLTGLCADVLAGNLDGVATDGWTAVQVKARRDKPTEDVLAEWDAVAPSFAAILDDFPGRYGQQVVADITVHEEDLRGALGRPGPRKGTALDRSVDFLLVSVADPGACALALPPLAIRRDDRTYVIGGRAATTDDAEAAVDLALATPLDDADSGAGVTSAAAHGGVTTTAYELFRALTGRRSEAQIRSWDWTVDPAPYVPLFSLGPFTIRSRDLVE